MSLLNQQIIDHCLTALRTTFKQKGLTYAQIAQHLTTSQVTVKRMMYDKNIKFERLLTLCALAQIPIHTLIDNASHTPAQHQLFTPAQDSAFARSAQLMHFFNLLVFEGMSIEEIEQQHGLDGATSYRYLRALEKIDLITLQPENKVQFNFTLPIGFAPDSLVLKQQLQAFIKQTSEAVIEQHDPQAFMIVKPLKLPLETHQAMLKELTQIIDKYAQLSEQYRPETNTQLRQTLVLDNVLAAPAPVALMPAKGI